MSKKNLEKKTFITQHLLELRHGATGKFLDDRGFIADYIKEEEIFPHWRIQENSISFLDRDNGIEKTGAIVSYNSVAFIAHNPSTQNYFKDQALAFWKSLQKNERYKIPELNRFGSRTKCYIPSNSNFEVVNNKIYSTFLDNKLKNTFGGEQTDLQIVLDLKDKNFQVRIILGPLKENEAARHFSFQTKEFNQTGLFLDIDYYQVGKIPHNKIQDLLRESMELTWAKIDNVVGTIDI